MVLDSEMKILRSRTRNHELAQMVLGLVLAAALEATEGEQALAQERLDNHCWTGKSLSDQNCTFLGGVGGDGGAGGVGVGAGIDPFVMTMSAHEFHTWSVSSQSQRQLRTYSPVVFGT